MDSPLQDTAVSSSTSQRASPEERPVDTNAPIQVDEVSSTTTNDVDALLMSLLGFD